MKKLRFFKKTPSENDTDKEVTKEESTNKISGLEEKKEIQSEYHEILQAGQSSSESYDDTLKYRDIKGIESNVDMLSYKSKHRKSDVEVQVDKVLSNKLPIKTRKKENVLYVVSKPMPGQNYGDWAVRNQARVYSHHRTKENAIKKARELASKIGATVLVQNMDGTFKTRFKPDSTKK
jgi:hypothetical protein